MTRVLITYASRMGSTEQIARAIADRIAERGLTTVVSPIDQVRSLDGVDAVIAGSAVYLRRWLPEAVGWLKANAAQLSERPTWLFQSGPCGADSPDPDRVQRAVQRIAVEIGTAPPVTFGGRLDRQFAKSPVQRWVTSGPLAGDYRNWAAIDRWVESIVERLTHQRITEATSTRDG